MTTILLLISLLLHVVAFYFIVVLYTKYSNVKELSDSGRKMLEETEASMTSFLIEMKDDNERLIQNLKRFENNLDDNNKQKTKERENVLSKANTIINNKKEYVMTDNHDEFPDYLSSINEVEDIIEINQSPQEKNLPFEIEAINLYKNGYTVEQIAKKLNKGKTEIELLLKFRQK